MTTYISGEVLTAASLNDNFTYAAANGGKIIQVVSVVKTDTFSGSSASYIDITGITVTITPTSATNKVFVFANIQGSNSAGVAVAIMQLVRDSTAIAVGDASGSRSVGTSSLNGGSDGNILSSNIIAFLDSPATTSATTYKVQAKSTAGTFVVNRSSTDASSAAGSRTVSTITVFEVQA